MKVCSKIKFGELGVEKFVRFPDSESPEDELSHFNEYKCLKV